MEVLGLFPPASYTQAEIPITLVIGGFPILLPPHIPDCFQHAQVYTMHRTNTSSLHLIISLPPLLVTWGWPPVLGQVRSEKETDQSRAAILPVNTQQTSGLLQILSCTKPAFSSPCRNRKQEVTSSLVSHQGKDKSTSQTTSKQNTRSRWLNIVISFLYPDKLGKGWLNQKGSRERNQPPSKSFCHLAARSHLHSH